MRLSFWLWVLRQHLVDQTRWTGIHATWSRKRSWRRHKSRGRELLCRFELCNLNLGHGLPTLNIAQKTRKQLWANRHHVSVKKCPFANQCTCRRVYADLSSVLVLVGNFSAFYFGTVHFAVLNSLDCLVVLGC